MQYATFDYLDHELDSIERALSPEDSRVTWIVPMAIGVRRSRSMRRIPRYRNPYTAPFRALKFHSETPYTIYSLRLLDVPGLTHLEYFTILKTKWS
jgi:hypothetical protein